MNLKEAKIALIGHNLPAREILQILSERSIPAANISVLIPERAQGAEISYGEDNVLPVRSSDGFDFSGVNAVFIIDPEAAKSLPSLPSSVKIIDASGRAATNPDIPMLLPGVKESNAARVALPGSISTPLIYALKILHDAFTVKRSVVAGFISASHQGQAGMDELFAQTRSVYVNDVLAREIFQKQIAFNLIPEVGNFMPDGAVQEEWQTAVEIKRVLSSSIGVAAQLIYAPMFLSNAYMVNVECEKETDAEAALAAFRGHAYFSVVDLRAEGGTITPAEVAGEDKIFISRVRDDSTIDNGLQFWITADALRAGLAWPAVRLMEKLLKN